MVDQSFDFLGISNIDGCIDEYFIKEDIRHYKYIIFDFAETLIKLNIHY